MDLQTIAWRDDHGRVAPPFLLYLLLAFLGRGYVIWVMSLTQAADRAGLVRIFYPLQMDFIQSLVTGLGAVLLFVLVLAERRRKPTWLKTPFSLFKWLLMMMLVLEAWQLATRIDHTFMVFHWMTALDGLALFWGSIYLAKSKHLQAYLDEWPSESLTT
ncbi:DUF2919 domain-containing protein [Shewanella sp. SNU WT4]|uniref:DUF2919 domain-containing protein n=1 Tax=Shewanella sp. SNU WT4 TaxID=2590015 RepID=UPI00112645B3|nr:DUF2919 domain-containing protein [Shewanella sp. SNU WT4]QDF67449.1 DUF2919 domain-containing protein [Shewanella sp. SNU WT4]